MIEHFYQPDGPQVHALAYPEDQLPAQLIHAKAELESRISELRADIFGKLLTAVHRSNGITWAVYGHDIPNENEGLAYADNRVETLIYATYVHVFGKFDPPHLRIVTKEPCRQTEHPGFIVEDVTIYSDSDAQYHCDAVTSEDGERLIPNRAPLFIYEEGKLEFAGGAQFTTANTVEEQNGAGETAKVVPLGQYDNFYDRAFAIDHARQTIAQVQSGELLGCGTNAR